MKRLLHLIVAGAAAIALAGPASAAPSRSELEARLAIAEQRGRDLQERLEALEANLMTGDPVAVSLQQRVISLEQELSRLTGILEQATYENRRLREEMQTTRRMIELRDEEIAGKLNIQPFTFGAFDEPARDPFAEARNAAGGEFGDAALAGETGFESDDAADDPFAEAKSRVTGSLGATSAVVLPDNPVDALDYAKRLLIDGQYDQAEEAFGRFAAAFSTSNLVGEALYWRGETFYLREGYEQAKDLYIESIQRDPKGPRAADAMVKLAASLSRMGFNDQACSTLQAFPRQYPNADLAVKAKAAREEQLAGCG